MKSHAPQYDLNKLSFDLYYHVIAAVRTNSTDGSNNNNSNTEQLMLVGLRSKISLDLIDLSDPRYKEEATKAKLAHLWQFGARTHYP